MEEARNLPRGVRLLACLLLITLCAVTQLGSTQSEPAPSAPPPPGRLIDLGGYKLHLNCTGQGRPTVVLSPGAGDFSFDWALVQPEVAKFTRVCSYDRSGAAWSDLGPKPRTVYQEVFDLRRLLAKAGERGPYILVGQSAGGNVGRIFAMQYRKEIKGLVLVDATHEDGQLFINGKWVRMRTLAKDRPIPPPRDSVSVSDAPSPEEAQKLQEFMTKVVGKPEIDQPFEKLPLEAQQERLWALAQWQQFATGDDYAAEVSAQLYAQDAKTKHPLGKLPLIVLSRTRDEYPKKMAAVLSAEHKDQQARLALLSSKGKQIIVPNSGHHIQLDAPDAVISAIQSMVTQVRR